MKIRFLKFSKFRKPKALRLISLIRLFVASNLAERYLVTLFEDYNFKQSRRIASIKGLDNVLTHLKAYLINTLVELWTFNQIRMPIRH